VRAARRRAWKIHRGVGPVRVKNFIAIFYAPPIFFSPQKNKTRHRAARLKQKHQYTFYMRIYCSK